MKARSAWNRLERIHCPHESIAELRELESGQQRSRCSPKFAEELSEFSIELSAICFYIRLSDFFMTFTRPIDSASSMLRRLALAH